MEGASMKATEYYQLLQDLGLGKLARMIGTGTRDHSYQLPCYTADSFVQSILMLNGKGSVWTSQNPYIPDNIGKFSAIVLDNFFVEFEGIGKEISEQMRAHADMLKLVEFAERNKWPITVAHSGNKSFHVRIRLDGQTEPWSAVRDLNNAYRDSTRGLADLLALQTVDHHCAEAKRLLRIPFTIGGARDGKPTYCVPIPVDLLSDFTAIQELIANPAAYPSNKYTTQGKQTSLDEVSEKVGKRWTHIGHDAISTDSGLQTYSVPNDNFVEYLEGRFSQKCVLNENLKPTPPHHARVALVAWMRFLDFSIPEAKELTDRIADFAKWDDRANKDRRDYQVENVMRSYQPFGCKRLKQEGWCVGEACDWFKSPEESK
mgnify:CR=1 FL=1